jgi:hypothetical protein
MRTRTTISSRPRRRKHRARVGAGQYLAFSQLSDFLAEHDYPIAPETLRKRCLPSRGKGPPVAGRWNGVRYFEPATVLAWAQQLFATTPARPSLRAFHRG